MRVAVITDIHANLPALRATLARVDELGVDDHAIARDLDDCGSVGTPKDGDPRAAFAVLETDEAGVTITVERVAYDAQAVAREVAAAGPPTEFADKLVRAA